MGPSLWLGLSISSHPSHVVADFVSFAATFFKSHRLTHAVAPPPRKKARLLRLFACKRAHNASAALPPFCGLPCSALGLQHKLLPPPKQAGGSFWLDRMKKRTETAGEAGQRRSGYAKQNRGTESGPFHGAEPMARPFDIQPGLRPAIRDGLPAVFCCVARPAVDTFFVNQTHVVADSVSFACAHHAVACPPCDMVALLAAASNRSVSRRQHVPPCIRHWRRSNMLPLSAKRQCLRAPPAADTASRDWRSGRNRQRPKPRPTVSGTARGKRSCGCSLASALTTPPRRYHLFAGCPVLLWFCSTSFCPRRFGGGFFLAG